MFRRLPEVSTEITIFFDDRAVVAAPGDSVAAALLAAGVTVFGVNRANDLPRAPRCLIGNCYECLVEIEGEGRRQACLVPVRDGMRVRTIAPEGDPAP